MSLLWWWCLFGVVCGLIFTVLDNRFERHQLILCSSVRLAPIAFKCSCTFEVLFKLLVWLGVVSLCVGIFVVDLLLVRLVCVVEDRGDDGGVKA